MVWEDTCVHACSAFVVWEQLCVPACHYALKLRTKRHKQYPEIIATSEKLKQLSNIVRVTQSRERAQFLYTRKMQPV